MFSPIEECPKIFAGETEAGMHHENGIDDISTPGAPDARARKPALPAVFAFDRNRQMEKIEHGCRLSVVLLLAKERIAGPRRFHSIRYERATGQVS
jgi:hypothetical protein